jgi:hypothetical protein
LYKIVFEVFANRLKTILPKIIAPTQSAFIPSRLISNNILAAYETLHTMQSRMWGNEGFMVVKLDMSKAYDQVEWGFLESVMKQMGFAKRCVNLIMMCVWFSNCVILINVSPMGRIYPIVVFDRGPYISLFVFTIC